MTARRLIAFAALGSAALLLGAFAFQHLGGLAPCKMCIWQRWPHAAAVVIGILTIVTGRLQLAWLGAMAALTTASIGLYHAGVEQTWWEGPTTCTSSGIGGMSADDLLNQIMNAPLVRCDEIPWQMLGVSMAGWNMLFSAALATVWIMAARRA